MDLRFALSSLVALVGVGVMAAVAGRRSHEQDLRGGERWSEEDVQKVLEFARRGMSASAIAQRIGMAPRTVLIKMRAAGIPARPRGGSRAGVKKWTEADTQQVLKFAREGVPLIEISRRVGMSQAHVEKILVKEHVKVTRDTWQPADLQRALQLVADGIPSRDASEATGVPVGAILVRMRGGRRGLSSIERQDAVVEALKLGFTQDEIVQLLDENPLYVANVAARPQRSATVLAVRAALADVARGMTPHAAALKHNVSYFVVLHRLRTASSGQAKGAPRAPGGGVA